MTTNGVDSVHIPCIDFVEMVTDYLDGVLAPDVVASIDSHLTACAGCLSVLEQFRETIRQTGRLRVVAVEVLDPSVREPLMDAFRDWAARRADD
jgi:anti-sigma factor RsiW